MQPLLGDGANPNGRYCTKYVVPAGSESIWVYDALPCRKNPTVLRLLLDTLEVWFRVPVFGPGRFVRKRAQRGHRQEAFLWSTRDGVGPGGQKGSFATHNSTHRIRCHVRLTRVNTRLFSLSLSGNISHKTNLPTLRPFTNRLPPVRNFAIVKCKYVSPIPEKWNRLPEMMRGAPVGATSAPR